ncbi:MAG: helix-turn-helix domain-containing protein, partial [Chloroflexota bacterium]
MPIAVENGSEIIVRAAKQQLYEEGFHKLSIRKIAKRCGLAVGTIYNYFPTKKDLIVRLMTDYWEEFYASSSSTLAGEINIYGKLQNIYNKLRQFVELFKESWIDIQDFNQQNPYEHSAQQMKYLQRLYDLVADLLKTDFERREKTPTKIDLNYLTRMIDLNYLTMLYTIQLP